MPYKYRLLNPRVQRVVARDVSREDAETVLRPDYPTNAGEMLRMTEHLLAVNGVCGLPSMTIRTRSPRLAVEVVAIGRA